MRRTLISFLAALAILTAAAPGRAAGDGSRQQLTPEEVAAQVKAAMEKGRHVTVRFKNGTRINGTVDEVRERGFTIVPYDFAARMGLKRNKEAAAIFYEDVASVERESKVKRFFRKTGQGFAIGGLAVVFIPVVTVAAALGKAPGC
ncbi:MAG TPA: hypothetical protein VGP08_08795 [Pyrinomonadaceae bacterium]|jgi:hypothetical protein|nr:hypothetical protein [Pyrinomonadaceae bacterium]